MWSLHPSARTDDVYVELIRMLGNELIAIPWARTNLPIDKSVAPIVHYAKAAPDYRPYKSWMAGPLRDQVGEVLDPKWFAETGLFIDSAVSSLRQNVMTPTSGTGPQAYPLYHLAGWLWSFRHFAEHVLPHAPKLNKHDIEPLRTLPASATIGNTDKRSAIRRRLADVRILLKSVRRVRKWWLRHEAIKRYPPE
jgi:hypothetical protein